MLRIPETFQWKSIDDRRIGQSQLQPTDKKADITIVDEGILKKQDSSAYLSKKKYDSNSFVTTVKDSDHNDYSPSESFIRDIYPAALNVASKTGIHPIAIVSQAALETGWGRYMITHKNGDPSFNFFGIKADKRWNGDSVEVITHEFKEGLRIKEKATFRSYNSIEEGFQDYSDFLDVDRYQKAIKSGKDIAAYVTELQLAGYATDPEYAQKIIRIARSEIMQNTISQIGEIEKINIGAM